VRMVRLRNPHQILMCVLKDGTIALFHYEPTVALAGWSRMTTQGSYIDVTVGKDEFDNDVPVMLVQRQAAATGSRELLIESIPQWEISADWIYMDSYVVQDNVAQTNVLSGFDHLEGYRLNVVGDGAYLGDFEVVGGDITLVDGYGEPITPFVVAAGLPKVSELILLPPVVDEMTTGGIGAYKSYSSIGLRLRDSQPPIINGIRPPTRAGNMRMDGIAPAINLDNVEIANVGYDEFQFITITEDMPVRCEIVGVFGQLESNIL
jgi:hypothetical protein